MEKNIMYNYTEEDHRIRLENIRFIETNLKSALRKDLITYYEPAQYVWPKVRFDNLEEDEKKLKELSEQGIDIIQIWEHCSDYIRPDGTLGPRAEHDPHQGEWMYRPYDKELGKKFIDLVHKYGMKVIPYTSTNFFVRQSPLFKEGWASDKMFDLGTCLAHCSALSPSWREQIVKQYATILDEYNFDGIYIDTGYQRITDYSGYMHYYDDEVRTAADEILAFPESREHDGGMQDLLGLIYGEVKRRGKILKLHKEGYDTVRTDFKVYDYLWVGEAVRNINHIREHSKAYDAYVVPDFNFGAIDDHERYLNTIPFMQFPVMRDAKMGIGSKDAGVPDFEQMVKWLKLYKTMTSYGTWAYVDIKVPKFVKPEGDETVVSAFINLDMYIVVANYSDEKDTVKFNGKFTEVTIDGDAGEVEGEITLNPRQMKVLRFHTPDEWKKDAKKEVGFDTAGNLLG